MSNLRVPGTRKPEASLLANTHAHRMPSDNGVTRNPRLASVDRTRIAAGGHGCPAPSPQTPPRRSPHRPRNPRRPETAGEMACPTIVHPRTAHGRRHPGSTRGRTYTAIRRLSRRSTLPLRRMSTSHTGVSTDLSGILPVRSEWRSTAADARATCDRQRMSVFHHGRNPPNACWLYLCQSSL